ncbi:MAG: UDP-N-acetylmuramoyl-L-alanine--D-glutamate ligase [Elusimicrobia bacterium]|jgi:UDP-N-acetylmuramoylalanine--D-glutamate ligase|nr:UDP-N-acetylmuramoyl-L-alanine--D-glutamate ligase [Elusimicrobiota bacterium]
MIKREYKDKKILIAGMARSGRAAFALLAEQGAEINGYDIRKNKTLRAEGSCPELLSQKDPGLVDVSSYDLVVISPGVKKNNKIIVHARELGIPVISELEVALSVLPPVKIIAVTGTNGKTTTAKIIEFLTGGILAGNVGTPLTSVVKDIKRDDLLILEVSSYQIPFSPSLSPDVAVLLNIFPEHLDWHGGYDNYIADKLLLFRRQTPGQAAVLNDNIRKTHQELIETIKSRKIFFSFRKKAFREKKIKGTYIKDKNIYYKNNSDPQFLMAADKYKLKGLHNLENLMAAVLAVRLIGIKKLPRISGFPVPAHRLEEVAEINGVLYINDSKATNMDSVYRAVTSLEGPVILLAGGRSKDIMHPGLKNAVRKNVKKIILFGENRHELKKYFNTVFEKKSGTLREAVKKAKQMAVKGDTVLLSPGGSSFDEFKDYRDRGNKFKKWVKE